MRVQRLIDLLQPFADDPRDVDVAIEVDGKLYIPSYVSRNMSDHPIIITESDS